MTRKRYVKAGTLADLQRVLWHMIRRVEALTDDDPPPDRVLRCAHALAQLSGAYRAVTEVVAIEQRIRALEMAAERNGNP
jgi:hypothetical protein